MTGALKAELMRAAGSEWVVEWEEEEEECGKCPITRRRHSLTT